MFYVSFPLEPRPEAVLSGGLRAWHEALWSLVASAAVTAIPILKNMPKQWISNDLDFILCIIIIIINHYSSLDYIDKYKYIYIYIY